MVVANSVGQTMTIVVAHAAVATMHVDSHHAHPPITKKKTILREDNFAFEDSIFSRKRNRNSNNVPVDAWHCEHSRFCAQSLDALVVVDVDVNVVP